MLEWGKEYGSKEVLARSTSVTLAEPNNGSGMVASFHISQFVQRNSFLATKQKASSSPDNMVWAVEKSRSEPETGIGLSKKGEGFFSWLRPAKDHWPSHDVDSNHNFSF